MTEITLDEIRAVVRQEMSRPVSPWLNPEAAAAYLCSTVGTLKTWRSNGTGPRYHIMQERLVRYNIEDLDRFVRTGER